VYNKYNKYSRRTERYRYDTVLNKKENSRKLGTPRSDSYLGYAGTIMFAVERRVKKYIVTMPAIRAFFLNLHFFGKSLLALHMILSF